jgi:hypothetical protein
MRIHVLLLCWLFRCCCSGCLLVVLLSQEVDVDDALVALAKAHWGKLKHLSLLGCALITDETVRVTLLRWSSLRSVDLTACGLVTKEAVDYLLTERNSAAEGVEEFRVTR